MFSVIRNIIKYLRHGVYDEFDEQERDYEKWCELRNQLPKLIRELESTLARLRELAD